MYNKPLFVNENMSWNVTVIETCRTYIC